MSKTNLIDKICTRCWGRGSVSHNVGTTGEYSTLCPRCKGTGDEPHNFDGWLIAALLVIFIVGLFFIWSVPTT